MSTSPTPPPEQGIQQPQSPPAPKPEFKQPGTPLSVLYRFLFVTVALSPWVVYWAGHPQTRSASRVWMLAGVCAAMNLLALFLALLNPVVRPFSPPLLVSAFALTFASLVGAYAAADYAASQSLALHDGQPITVTDRHGVSQPTFADCYGNPKSVQLDKADAIYVALGTLTTIGAGDIAAHRSCRSLLSVELAFGWPLLALAIGGVVARLFQNLEKEVREGLAAERRARRKRLIEKLPTGKLRDRLMPTELGDPSAPTPE